MLRIALGLVVVALIAALLGFGGVAGLAIEGAQLFFFGFIALVVIAVLFGSSLLRR